MKLNTLILLLLLGLLLLQGSCTYNKLVTKEGNVENAWAKVESAYQRRADLIPNLVNTVKGYADFEQETLTQVVEARAKATSVSIDPSNISPQQLQQFQAAQGELSGALSRLLVTIEKYPDLKANQNFLELQSQLESTENRIKVERDRFNDVATEYNIAIKKFPTNLYAGIFGFDEHGLFEADPGTEVAPEVDFAK